MLLVARKLRLLLRVLTVLVRESGIRPTLVRLLGGSLQRLPLIGLGGLTRPRTLLRLVTSRVEKVRNGP